ncbi:phosphonate ABC transporter substrate-binding protein [Chthonobacter rhizosphaerae]|uniref:phosphonate ABC transporter substrate-binding protein n=1 Tax=Chthonobacter rhizosphaerae TaxID=2735553 RepID=UPI0015EEB2E1|nr:phosphonate ABC transporter substrate-binding protein [Chthonobacter rhizosphaerae]
MLTRRTVLGAALAAATLASAPAVAADWKTEYPEITFAIVPAENASGVTERWGPYVDYLSKELGVKVTLRIAQDYAAVIEGQRSGEIHVAYYGPSAFARALMTGVNTEAFAMEVSKGGVQGYYSVFYVKAESPYQKIEDLKGKNLGLVDPNSTSGNNVPRFEMDKMGIDPETFFSKVVYAGSHENAVTALQQGTVDVAANWWNAEDDSNLLRMATKGMVKAEDYRVIYKSPMIVNSPVAYLADLPADMKTAIKAAFLESPVKAKEAFDRISDGKNEPWAENDNSRYDTIIELNKFVDALKKKKAS